jgi:sulfur carrier protein ThiS
MHYESSICDFQSRKVRDDGEPVGHTGSNAGGGVSAGKPLIRARRWHWQIRMKVTARLLPTRKETRVVELEKGATVEDLIRELELRPDAWIAVRGDDPLPSDEELAEGDEIRLVSVVSGG